MLIPPRHIPSPCLRRRGMPTIFLHLGKFQPAKVGKFQPAETGEYSTGVDNSWPVLLKVLWQLLDGHPVHASTSLIGLDSFQCLLAVFPPADLLHQLFANGRAFCPALRRERFGPLHGSRRSFTPTLLHEGQL